MSRRKRWEDSAIHSDLKHWGYWYCRIVAADGYPPIAAIARLFEGMSHRFGHKVLIPDMPGRAWDVHCRVSALGEPYVLALIARYCVPPRDLDGRMYSSAELAKAIGCTPDAYRQRVSRARARLRALEFAA